MVDGCSGKICKIAGFSIVNFSQLKNILNKVVHFFETLQNCKKILFAPPIQSIESQAFQKTGVVHFFEKLQ